ncbi:MAG TPA: glutamate formimidoyltransferase, partial [Bacteroidetes bacterium]|nr:glutamate formimidoyltransferase [Bacteroidota bacterium]
NACWDTMTEIAKIGNISSKSDLEVGAKILETGIWGAFKNVEINLPQVTDEKFKSNVLKECNVILKNSEKKFSEVCDILSKR